MNELEPEEIEQIEQEEEQETQEETLAPASGSAPAKTRAKADMVTVFRGVTSASPKSINEAKLKLSVGQYLRSANLSEGIAALLRANHAADFMPRADWETAVSKIKNSRIW